MGQPYNNSVDWWSFGVLIFEMLTGCSPFNGLSEEDLYKDIIRLNLYFPPSLSTEAVDCLKLFFEREPNKRLGMKTSPYGKIRDQKFFTRVNWDQIETRKAIPPFKPSTVKSLYFFNREILLHSLFFRNQKAIYPALTN